MTARIKPMAPPFTSSVQAVFDKLMPDGVPPLSLFTMLARDPRLFGKFMAGGLLDKGHLTLRQREIVIDRVTAQCGSEYEWGVHIAFFAVKVGFTEAEIASLVHGTADDPCWSESDERLLIQLCDALHSDCQISDALWNKLAKLFSEDAMLELMLLCGFYRTVSYLTNGARLPLESFAARFPAMA
ncbi:MAG: carboxymuconolactone decarboxylase family protein [Alphaproteobacteria bacterium]|nr:carboxymuconolactone decarboxylase family protein [Alphaproteobacteria bacterium]